MNGSIEAIHGYWDKMYVRIIFTYKYLTI